MKLKRYTREDLSRELKHRLDAESFFGSPGFAALWTTVGGRDVYWMLEDNQRPLALLAGVEFGFGPLRRMQAMPDGCYARLVLLEEQERYHGHIMRRFMKELADSYYAKLTLYDYSRQLPEVTGYKTMELETTVVDISRDWQPPDKKIRQEIRKAEREGIAVVPFDRQEHFSRFIKLMHLTEQRHGRGPKYPVEFFESLADLAVRDQRVCWRHVEVDSQAAASHIFFIEGDMALHWQVYFDKQFSYLKPNQYLLFDTARQLADRGVKRLNLGASPDEASGLKSYKDKWGGETYTYPAYVNYSLVGNILW